MTSQDSSETDYYTILEVPVDSSEPEIVAAYKRMMLKWHPDRHRNKPPATRKYAAAMAALLNEARDVLTDRRKRAEYDAEFHSHSRHRQSGHTGNAGAGRQESQYRRSEADGNNAGSQRSNAYSESRSSHRTDANTRRTTASDHQSTSEAAFRAGQGAYERVTEDAGKGAGRTVVIVVLVLVALALAGAVIYGVAIVAVAAVTAAFSFLTSAVQAFFNFLTQLLIYAVALAIVGGFLYAMVKMRE